MYIHSRKDDNIIFIIVIIIINSDTYHYSVVVPVGTPGGHPSD